MPEIRRSVLLPYSAEFMYAIVNDVESYPRFLPWCGDARIDAVHGDGIEASLKVDRAGFERWFRTRNRNVENQSIDMTLVEGPFESLEGHWQFVALGDSGCRVELVLNFRMKPGIRSAIMAAAFTRIADTMVDSFCDRARTLDEQQKTN